MKRLILALTLALLVLGSASAQSNWFGLRSGYPLGVTLHYGIQNGFSPGIDLRVSANMRVRGGNVNFGVGVDALNVVTVEGPFEVYIGGGPAIDVGGGGVLLDIHGLVGGEFRLRDAGLEQLGLFAELALGAGIGIGRPSIIPTFGGAVGFNWRF